MEQILHSYIASLFVISIYFCIWFLIAFVRNNISILDIGWSTGFTVISAFTIIYNKNLNNVSLLLFNLILVWSARLSIHLLMRQWSFGEDTKYKELRKQSKKDIWKNALMKIVPGHILSLLIISYPIIVVNTYAKSFFDQSHLIGIAIWLFGFAFEFLSDYQLYKFRNLSKQEKDDIGWTGKIMKYGLWKYSRHPNYFGEILIWVGIFLFAFQFPFGLFGFISPLCLFILLLFVTGIPRIEKNFSGNRNYESYKKSTSNLIPLPSRDSTNKKPNLEL